MTPTDIRNALFQMRDEPYRAFQAKLIPTVDPDTMIGVRTPALRKLARQLYVTGDSVEFLNDLPHRYFDENQLHAFILSGMRNFDDCITAVCIFLPFVDNWATCDQLSPKIFKEQKTQLLRHIRRWLDSGRTYTIRFAIGMLMAHYLDEDFEPEYPQMVAVVQSDEYYVKMMVAWYFATALAKQYCAVLPYIEVQKLDPWIHNKAIQKALESYRIPDEHKTHLRELKVRVPR